VASGLVLVDDLLVSDAIYSAHGVFVNNLSGGLVASFNRLDNLLHRSAQFRTQTAVVGILLDCLTGEELFNKFKTFPTVKTFTQELIDDVLDCLTGTFPSLCAICHDYSLKFLHPKWENSVQREARILVTHVYFCKFFCVAGG
jgi:hypothetical protein